MTDNKTQFVSKSFHKLCTFLEKNNLTTTAYYPQKNERTERFKKTMITGLRHYTVVHRQNWDIYVQELMNAFKA